MIIIKRLTPCFYKSVTISGKMLVTDIRWLVVGEKPTLKVRQGIYFQESPAKAVTTVRKISCILKNNCSMSYKMPGPRRWQFRHIIYMHKNQKTLSLTFVLINGLILRLWVYHFSSNKPDMPNRNCKVNLGVLFNEITDQPNIFIAK